jgi:hypothetical protein
LLENNNAGRITGMKKMSLLCMLLAGLMLSGCAGGDGGATVTPPIETLPIATQTVGESPLATPAGAAVSPGSASQPGDVVVHNTEYGFDFVLPNSWQGYSIVAATWAGLGAVGENAGKSIATGPDLSIRHPQWTEANPRQDIPILIFTLQQWDDLQKEVFHIGAAPVPPTELGRNSRYVFALPARYNFAFPTGYEEVENILANQALRPTEEFDQGAGA